MEKKKILIIDDEKGFTEIVKTALEETGKYEVKEENHSKNAIIAARTFKPHLILLDLMMPELDGSAVAGQLRADDQLQNVPIVFLTAVVTTEEVNTQEQSGMIGGHLFIAKPVKMKELFECIEENAL